MEKKNHITIRLSDDVLKELKISLIHENRKSLQKFFEECVDEYLNKIRKRKK